MCILKLVLFVLFEGYDIPPDSKSVSGNLSGSLRSGVTPSGTCFVEAANFVVKNTGKRPCIMSCKISRTAG